MLGVRLNIVVYIDESESIGLIQITRDQKYMTNELMIKDIKVNNAKVLYISYSTVNRYILMDILCMDSNRWRNYVFTQGLQSYTGFGLHFNTKIILSYRRLV